MGTPQVQGGKRAGSVFIREPFARSSDSEQVLNVVNASLTAALVIPAGFPMSGSHPSVGAEANTCDGLTADAYEIPINSTGKVVIIKRGAGTVVDYTALPKTDLLGTSIDTQAFKDRIGLLGLGFMLRNESPYTQTPGPQ